ncbi:hypothetical protein KOR42_52010 [Thalassoglobus neptunius]|uniref:DUF3634 domain-containing protein n=1 Tax=Thalassoglobus neptunius TaxID=1938619 RepID=A0A5C5V932_9PLAN|nr:hypothetical protein [Thalassoglobus neptunius]TWT35106.1 hypothetical protein KOR42_52010 [Thalassoglobus neptunius]
MEPLNIIAVVALIGIVFWSIRGKSNAVVTLVFERNELTQWTGISKKCASEIDEFVKRDLEVSERIVVRGFPSPNGGIRYEIRGASLDPGTEQQIRNFLKQVVCHPAPPKTRCQ